jgi:hypothetical protein
MNTFIVAEKVIMDTKNDEDEQITFEITDVFKGLNYLKSSLKNSLTKSVTTIRVYLKKGFQLNIALQHIRSYCRYIEDLTIYYDGNQQLINESWHVEGANHHLTLQTERYLSQLCIDVKPRPMIATNSGFLIAMNPASLLPFKFPKIIGGEINFSPKETDFDMSRTNIMESGKSQSFR